MPQAYDEWLADVYEFLRVNFDTEPGEIGDFDYRSLYLANTPVEEAANQAVETIPH